MATATFTKLKSGEWGVRVVGTVRVGDTVTVSRKDGTSEQKVVGVVVWSGNGITLCTLAASGRPSYTPQAGKQRRRRTGCSCGSYEDEVNAGDCWTCRHDQE